MILHNKGVDDALKIVPFWKNNHEHRTKMREQIASIIVGKSKNPVFRALLHSELDADRLDYLLRDSFFISVVIMFSVNFPSE